VPLLSGPEKTAASVSQGASAVRGRLRVNIDPFFSRLLLGSRLGTFVEKYPELQLDLITRDQLGDMVADGFDPAVRFGEPRESTLIARKLLHTRIVTVASPAYIKKNGRPLAPADPHSRSSVTVTHPPRRDKTHHRVAQIFIHLHSQGEILRAIRLTRLAIGTFTNSLIFLAW
jgi:DNA-binding transcriptional LysR family regulator